MTKDIFLQDYSHILCARRTCSLYHIKVLIEFGQQRAAVEKGEPQKKALLKANGKILLHLKLIAEKDKAEEENIDGILN